MRNPIVAALVASVVTGLVVFMACYMVWYHAGGSAWRSWKGVEEAQLTAPDRLSLIVNSCEGTPQISTIRQTEVDIQVQLYVLHILRGGADVHFPQCLTRVDIPLSEPLGNRKLIDLHTGQSVSVSSPGPPPEPTPEPVASIIVDKGLARVAEQWPGFGGYYLERQTHQQRHWYVAYVYMQDACQYEEAEMAVKQLVYPEEFWQDIFGVYALEADYSIVQLGRWYEHVNGITDPGIVETSLDESRNRLEIRVVDDAAAQRVEEKLKELPVPRESVAVRIREPVKLYEPQSAYEPWSTPVPPAEVKEQLSDAQLQDLEAIALQKGISLEAVIERYGSKGSLLTVVDAIRETFPDDYAWSSVAIGGRGQIGFAGRPPAAALWMIEGFANNHWGASVEVYSHVGFTELEKQNATSAFHFDVFDALEVGVGGSRLESETGRLTTDLQMHGGVCDAAVIDDVRASATQALMDATRVDILNSIKIDLIVHPIDTTWVNPVDGPVLTSPPSIGLFGGMDAIVSGTLHFDESAGCLYLGTSDAEYLTPVVWPHGASWQADPPAVKIQGQLAEPGTFVDGGGGEISIAAIRNVAGVAVADAAKACGDHVGTEKVDFFNVGSEVDVGR